MEPYISKGNKFSYPLICNGHRPEVEPVGLPHSIQGSSTNFTRVMIEWTNNQNITYIQMSTTTQNIDQQSTEVKSSKPTWQDIEKAIVIITQAGVYYKKKKDEKFMQNYKKRYTELHQAEDPDIYILNNAKRIFPNEEKYIEMKKQYQECQRLFCY
ncbi:hypothetical protein Glove_276g2 [Diversispora epigaea]|uniref:Uncharacterized protein n=1 Tax=Diversispora epigaea TaxID=1348612 RepID=A0A397I961_9GLOM|nr:hypothetical protein Glove_276g2 [Diversispora epigaea]